MEKVDHMKDALAARRGKGLEIIIGMGEPKEPEGRMQEDSPSDYKRSDLAPPPVSQEDKNAVMNSAAGLHAPHPDGVIEDQHEMGPGDVPTPDDARAHFSQNMSEHDIKDMASRKPRSLMERARQHAFEKKKV